MVIFRSAVIALCLALALLAASAVVVGRAFSEEMPNRLVSVGLDECDGKLCLWKIVPGVTSWYVARNKFAGYATRSHNGHFHSVVDSVEVRVDRNWTESQVRRVEVRGPRGQGTLALPFSQIIDRFGQPCYISNLKPRGGGLVIAYPSFTVWVLADQGRISPDSEVASITLMGEDEPGFIGDQCRKGWTYGGAPWRGFASMEFYKAMQ